MAGFKGKMLLAAALFLGSASSAQAWWGWGWRWAGYGPGYPAYYVPTYYYYPVFPVCATPLPIMQPAASLPKKGSEAPRGVTSKEPPTSADMMKKGPIVTESRSLGGAYANAGTAKDRCKVGFWNLTGRDVTLKIDGQQRVLPKNRAVTLDLERSFAWQLDQGETVTERVPDEEPFHEVIIRQ